MAAPLKLSTAFERNMRLEPLIDKSVVGKDVEFDWDFSEPGGMFVRHLTKNEFDAFEFSLSHFFCTRSLPNPMYAGWTLMPIFTTKPIFMFRDLYVRDGSGIKTLADLKGKRFGIPDFSMTAGIWLRIILRTVFGVEGKDITWINTRPPHKRQMRAMGVDHDTKAGIRMINNDAGEDPQAMFERGDMDIAISAEGVNLKEAPGIRLFGQERGMEAFYAVQQKTGVMPVNHGMVLQKKFLAARPDLPRDIYDAFLRSKEAAYARDPKSRLVFPQLDPARQKEMFGDDPFKFGLKANRRALELVTEQLVIDGIIDKAPEIDPLIPEALRNT